jgi:hypothetical protein
LSLPYAARWNSTKMESGCKTLPGGDWRVLSSSAPSKHRLLELAILPVLRKLLAVGGVLVHVHVHVAGELVFRVCPVLCYYVHRFYTDAYNELASRGWAEIGPNSDIAKKVLREIQAVFCGFTGNPKVFFAPVTRECSDGIAKT